MVADDDWEVYYPCIGVCMADADEAYCIGCGRPLRQREADEPRLPNAPEEDTPAASA